MSRPLLHIAIFISVYVFYVPYRTVHATNEILMLVISWDYDVEAIYKQIYLVTRQKANIYRGMLAIILVVLSEID